MPRSAKPWPWLVVICGGVGATLLLRKSDADRIRDDLRAIAIAANFDGGAPKPAWVAALRSSLAAHVADPITIEVAPFGEDTLARDPLLETIRAAASNHAGLRVSIANIGVKVDANEQRASAKGELLLDILEPSGERRNEPRRFAATFERRDRGWLIVHAQISEPRVDEPEPRP